MQVMADGTVNYYLKYRAPNRKQRFHCIGPATLISCPAARNRAEEILAAAKHGQDIIGEQRAESFEPGGRPSEEAPGAAQAAAD